MAENMSTGKIVIKFVGAMFFLTLLIVFHIHTSKILINMIPPKNTKTNRGLIIESIGLIDSLRSEVRLIREEIQVLQQHKEK